MIALDELTSFLRRFEINKDLELLAAIVAERQRQQRSGGEE